VKSDRLLAVVDLVDTVGGGWSDPDERVEMRKYLADPGTDE
jgi:hypothetical protein